MEQRQVTLDANQSSRRVQCAGSRQLEELYRKKDKNSLEEETHTAITVILRMLEGKKISDQYPQEMVEGAQLFIDTIESVKKRLKNKCDVYIDTHMTYQVPSANWKIIINANPLCYIAAHDNSVLYILDYKYGHRPVYPKRNWKLVSYAYGIVQNTPEPPTRVDIMTVQPRLFDGSNKVKSWRVHIGDIEGNFNYLLEREFNSTILNAPCTSGPECIGCSAKHSCVTLQDSALAIGESYHPQKSLIYSPDQIGTELKFLEYAKKILDARILGLSEQATCHLKSGESVRGYQLKPGRGKLCWNISTQEVETLGVLFNKDLLKKPEPITPNQAIKAGIDEEIVLTNCKKENGGLKLVQIDGDETSEIFQNLS